MMAIQEQVEILQQGAMKWNIWREQNREVPIDLRGANLSGADLRGTNLRYIHLNGADLRGANLSGAYLEEAYLNANFDGTYLGANLEDANLSGAHLSGAHLSGADLVGADLSGADLSGAILIGADLVGADLSGADLSGAGLVEADLVGADLVGAQLGRAILRGANLSGASVGWTIFGSLDLRTVIGLETIHHIRPSEISTSALEQSEGDIPEIFLKGAGLSDESISYAKSFLQHPIQYYSCFISYSSQDQDFAERLYADLQQKGIRCWFAPHSLKIGDHFPRHIEEAIRVSDKLLLILSHHSIESEWVEDEVRAALEKEQRFRKEQQQERMVLFPLQIDPAIEHTSTQWAAKLRRTRHIGNFQSWKEHDTYKQAFDRLLRDLKADPKNIHENRP